ncbi:hypothetical protein [Solilutibacter silvestris]|uniref:Lipoprotein n=1 Tax=Solilutibacter silvestris TaxID=1645665 RepID=A0A2K1PXY6_9GAMM|nr:hypothetical protein [Lysobacter silvestris]PNS07650.1 hypothetical protein Lysil_1826 [Lysobacter silvestris]
MKRMVLILALALAGCATSSHVMTGVARPAISPDQVKIYTTPPPGKYEQIAVIDANSSRAMAISSQQKTDAVVARLKEEAAKLGANGIILQGINDQASGGGVSLGGFSMGGNVGIGTGVSIPVTRKAGNALAIYVSP